MIGIEPISDHDLEKVTARVAEIAQRQSVVLERLAVMAKFFIEERLAAAIGDQKRHFTVSILPASQGINVQVKVNSDIGRYIYYGTNPHYITSSAPMPINNGNFAYKVYHPGTPSRKQEIDAAIRDGYAMAAASVII